MVCCVRGERIESTKNDIWHQFPPIVLPSPVLALATGPGGIWAGGSGGIAWAPTDGDWQPRVSGLPLTSVAALARADRWLLAGGTEGITRSSDGGMTWRLSKIQGGGGPVAAITASPRFAQDTTALAATLDSGILRTDDGGHTWKPATFGLQNFEVSTLAWGPGETVLAATADGIYRSPNAGRAWRAADGSEGASVAALAYLPGGTALAALEIGGLLRSENGGSWWFPHGDMPQNVQATALIATHDGVLLGTAGHGILHSTDGGTTWDRVHEGMVLSFASDLGTYYAGMADGVCVSRDGGKTWRSLSIPPVHDLRQLLVVSGRLLVAGPYAGLVQYLPGRGWEVLLNTPRLLTAIAVAPDGAIYASSPTGLARSADAGATWHTAVPGDQGSVARITFRADGTGFAGSADGARLLRTYDDGRSWESLSPPFGVLTLAALQAVSGALVAATYDHRQHSAQVWRSCDDGQTWEFGPAVHTSWPLVATCDRPPLLSLGGAIFRYRSDGGWDQISLGSDWSGVRRVVGDGRALLALTTMGLMCSADQGITWVRDDGLPIDQIMDIEIVAGKAYVLLPGGHVLSRPL